MSPATGTSPGGSGRHPWRDKMLAEIDRFEMHKLEQHAEAAGELAEPDKDAGEPGAGPLPAGHLLLAQAVENVVGTLPPK